MVHWHLRKQRRAAPLHEAQRAAESDSPKDDVTEEPFVTQGHAERSHDVALAIVKCLFHKNLIDLKNYCTFLIAVNDSTFQFPLLGLVFILSYLP